MKIELETNEFTKPVGTYIEPMLDVGYIVSENKIKVWFNNEEEIMELYERYKYDITYDWGVNETISIDEFLQTEHILILLGCVDGKEHEVLYS